MLIDCALALIAGYLLGSIPNGVWIARSFGIDVQRQGSGNIGATNVARTVGKVAGIATLLGDALKGAAAVWLAQTWAAAYEVAAVAGLAAMIGHSFSLFLGFQGGKGVATALGAFLLLTPLATAASIATFVLVAVATRYASVASITAAVILPIAALTNGYPASIVCAATAAALLVIGRHRGNLQRLANGSEPKFRNRS